MRWVRNFGNEASKMREQMEKQRRKREKRTEKMRGMREKFRRKRSKILIFFCNTVNSTILCLELYCSSIAKKFAILLFTIL